MNKVILELRQQYFNLALSVKPEELYCILPPASYSNFLDVIRGVIESLNTAIENGYDEIKSITDEEEREFYLEEVEELKLKVKICQKILSDFYSITEEEKIDESKKINIIFGVTPSGGIAFLNDLKRNVDEHYYSEILDLLDELEKGTFVNNPEKMKKFNTNNSKLAGLLEIKGFQIRIFFRQLPNNFIYIDMVRVKKDDNVTKDIREPINRLSLLASDFELAKRRIKNGDRVEELIIEGEEMMAEVKDFLNMSLSKWRGKNGK